MSTFEIVRLEDIERILQPVVEAKLAPLGFECVKTLRWVRSADAPIRQVFGFLQWKGGKLAPRWGLSLDFVPHISGGRIKWHRTPKSAVFDLCVDARDRVLDMPYIQGIDPISKIAGAVASEAITRARAFWDSARSIPDLLVAFDWLKRYLSTGLGFDNYVQHPIALAFVLALNGRVVEGQSELERFIHRGRLDSEEATQLRQLLAQMEARAQQGGCTEPGDNAPVSYQASPSPGR